MTIVEEENEEMIVGVKEGEVVVVAINSSKRKSGSSCVKEVDNKNNIIISYTRRCWKFLSPTHYPNNLCIIYLKKEKGKRHLLQKFQLSEQNQKC